MCLKKETWDEFPEGQGHALMIGVFRSEKGAFRIPAVKAIGFFNFYLSML